MAKEDIAPYKHNLALKQTFKQLGLDLTQVMEFSPFDLDMENLRLESLLDFVHRYQQYNSRETMELIEGDFLFPPIFPGISPDSDWFRFELWLQGEPVRKKLSDQLPKSFELKKPELLSEEEIALELEKLAKVLLKAGCSVNLHEGTPIRLQYDFLVETLDEIFELGAGGYWHLDGCDGYCPGCFQRLWCDVGDRSCWPEDEAAGKMSLIDALSPYVCASPQSLQILQKYQAEEDARHEQFEAENPEFELGRSELDEDWKAKLN